jgi:hypothetical protein
MARERKCQGEERRLDTRGGDDGAVHGDAEHGCVAARAGPAAIVHVLVDAGRHLAVRVEVGADVQRANLCETRDTERVGMSGLRVRVRGYRVRVCSAQERVRICARQRRPRTSHVRRIGHTNNLNGATLGGRDERTRMHGIEGDVLGRIRVPGSGLVVADP